MIQAVAVKLFFDSGDRHCSFTLGICVPCCSDDLTHLHPPGNTLQTQEPDLDSSSPLDSFVAGFVVSMCVIGSVALLWLVGTLVLGRGHQVDAHGFGKRLSHLLVKVE